MPLLHSYQSTPIGSISLLPEQGRLKYVELFHKTPKKIHTILSSPDTGSYIRGLGKSYDAPEDSFPKIAQAIFFVAIGEKSLAQLPAILSTELKLPNDKAQNMAAEIEKDIFGPVKAELDEFLSRKVASQPRDAVARKSLQNVLNLKELPIKKAQPQLPPRPVQKDFPVPPTQPANAPHPSPLPERERGTTKPQAPKFPLPRKSPLPPPLTPPRAGGETTPIRFT